MKSEDLVRNAEPIQFALFQKVLGQIKSLNPSMIELGCAEAFYSQMFNEYFGGNCKNICMDILPRQIESAKNNCPNAEFIHGYVGEPVHRQEVKENNYGAPRIYLKDLIDKIDSGKINLLHMDIQGSETYVMQEIEDSEYLSDIEYMFISLHGTQEDVKMCIPKYFEYLYDHPTQGGEGDGLIVIKNKNFEVNK